MKNKDNHIHCTVYRRCFARYNEPCNKSSLTLMFKSVFTKVLHRHSQKSNVGGIELEKDLSSGFSGFVNFFSPSFSSFCDLFAAVIDVYWHCFQFKHFWDTGSFLLWNSKFFTEISEHFDAYLRISDLERLPAAELDDANFGERWWHQSGNKDQR